MLPVVPGVGVKLSNERHTDAASVLTLQVRLNTEKYQLVLVVRGSLIGEGLAVCWFDESVSWAYIL